MIDLFIIDDHQIFRDGLKLLFEDTEDLTVIGEAESGETALVQLTDMAPDLILMDIQMSGMNGIETTREIKAMQPEVHILMLTMFEDGCLKMLDGTTTLEEVVRVTQET